MKKSIPLIIVLSIIVLVGSGVNNQANSYLFMGSYKSCLHNNDEYIQIGSNQSCYIPHQNIGSSPAKHAGINPEDCIIEEIIRTGEFD